MADMTGSTKRNMGGLDRILRVGIGLLLIYFGFIDTRFIGQPILASLVGVVGVLNILSSLIGFCPAYKLAGICTYKPDEARKSDT